MQRTGKTESEVVVPVARAVVVAIGRAAVPGVVVPAAAPFHPVGAAFRRPPKDIIFFLNQKLSANDTWSMILRTPSASLSSEILSL